MRDFVMPPASYSQIISLLSRWNLCLLFNSYTLVIWLFLSCYWSDFKKHDSFIAWYNSKYNESKGHYSHKYEYNAIIFNPATFYDYCKICEYASQQHNKRKNEEENRRDREVRDNQIANLKELTNYIQSLQDKDINTLTSVLESDKDIASHLTLETPTEKMLYTYTL